MFSIITENNNFEVLILELKGYGKVLVTSAYFVQGIKNYHHAAM